VAICLVLTITVAYAAQAEDLVPKYIFMMIGDGMALNQRAVTELYLAGLENPDRNAPKLLAMSYFPVQGMSRTYSANEPITDSAAAGTALACGYKTNNGLLGMGEDGTRYMTVAEMAKAKGKKVGILSSVSLNHATPAAYYSHQPSRGNYYEIAIDLAESGVDYFAGGGLSHARGREGDQPDAFALAQENGFTVTETREELTALTPGVGKVYATNQRLVGGDSLPYAIDCLADDITLAEFTQRGIELLDNPSGFFMMVEGGKIDWTCHGNDAGTMVREVIAFDEAVAVALDWYRSHPDETLIVVTGDHETGGLSLGNVSNKTKDMSVEKLGSQRVSAEEFNKRLALLKERFEGSPSLEDILVLIRDCFGVDPLPDSAAAKRIEAAYEASVGKTGDGDTSGTSYGGQEPLTITLQRILADEAGISYTTFDHSATPVPVLAQGVGQEKFDGYYENTDIARKLMELIGMAPQALPEEEAVEALAN